MEIESCRFVLLLKVLFLAKSAQFPTKPKQPKLCDCLNRLLCDQLAAEKPVSIVNIMCQN